jgi:hypothetical protein
MEKPCAVIVPPRAERPDSQGALLMSETARLDADRAMIRELQNSTRDQIGEQFGGRYYKTHYLWWNRVYKGQPIEVTRYYPDRSVAVDIFKVIEKEEQAEIDFKRALFPKIGVRYAALSEATSELTDVVAQVGLGG